MKPTVLVVTTVHWPDDTRIRERLIRTLDAEFNVVYACKEPGPSDQEGLVVRKLPGGRIRRNLKAVFLVLRANWDILVLHDPETLPAGFMGRWLRRRPVVFDVHENVPTLALTRAWVPELLRKPLAWGLTMVMRLAERVLTLTLAEEGYSGLFKQPHPVFPNYPNTGGYPELVPASNGRAVYLGDITIERGGDIAIQACAGAGVPIALVGRLSEEVRTLATSTEGVEALGLLPNPEAIGELAASAVALSPLKDLPNYRHSQPTKILEYLAMGVPVVASDLPGTRALVDGLDAVTLVAPDDSSALAAAVKSAIDPDVRLAAQMQAHTIRESFSWPDGEVRAFYSSLV